MAVTQQQYPATKALSWKTRLFRRKNSLILLAMAFPFVIHVVFFNYVPLFGWIYAFYDYRPGVSLADSEFVGFKYFRMALDFDGGSELLKVLRNTIALSFLALLTSPLPVIFAILVSEVRNNIAKRFIQTLTTLPYFMSWILVFAVAFATFSINDGFVNQLMIQWGLRETPINPLANDKIAWWFQTGISVWKNLGFNAIIYIAAMGGIDPELYDASAVDGAGRLRKIWHVTVPGIMPTFIVLLLLQVSNFLTNGFDQFYAFMNPLVQDKLEVFDYYVFRVGIAQGMYPLSTALGIFKTVVSVTLLFSVNTLAKKIRGESII